MSLAVQAYFLAVAVGAVLCLSLSVRVAGYDRPGARWFAATLLTIGVWSGEYLLNWLVSEPLFARVLIWGAYVATAFVGPLFLLFALAYTGRERYIGAPLFAVLAADPLFVAVGMALNPGGLFYESFRTVGGVLVTTSYGPLYLAHFVATSVFLGIASFLLVEMAARSKAMGSGQAATVAVAVALPWLGTVQNTVSESAVLSAAEPLLAVSGVLLWVALFNYGFVDLAPVARERVLNTLDSAVLVVGPDGRIADANAAAGEFLGADPDRSVGRGLAEVLADAGLPAGEPLETMHERDALDADDGLSLRPEVLELDGRGHALVLHDVTEQRRRERELERQNERLDRFASAVSHDLRNPLTVSRGHAEFLDGAVGESEQEHVERIQESNERMEAIVEEVLALARNGGEPDVRTVALDGVAARAWAQVETDGATLDSGTGLSVAADPDRLQRVLENLFRNSVEHGSTDGRASSEDAGEHGSDGPGLTVRVRETAGGFAVTDDGRGFPSGWRDREAEGVGLGLSIVERAAEAHGWTVEYGESERGGARVALSGVEKR
jgi:signal transduction histidine kinase